MTAEDEKKYYWVCRVHGKQHLARMVPTKDGRSLVWHMRLCPTCNRLMRWVDESEEE